MLKRRLESERYRRRLAPPLPVLYGERSDRTSDANGSRERARPMTGSASSGAIRVGARHAVNRYTQPLHSIHLKEAPHPNPLPRKRAAREKKPTPSMAVRTFGSA